MNLYMKAMFAVFAGSVTACVEKNSAQVEGTCDSSLTINMPDGTSTDFSACESYSFDASYEFDPDDVPEIRTLSIELSATAELGFECGATLELQGVCGPGYYMLDSSSGSLTLVSFDCEGVGDAFEGEYHAIGGFVQLDELDTGSEKGNFSNQPLDTVVSGSINAELSEGIGLSGSFRLEGSVVATDAEEMACSVVVGDTDGDGLLSSNLGGSDCYDDDATQGVCGSVYLNGEDAYGEHPDGAAFCTEQLTVEAWVKPSSFDESSSWSNVLATDDWYGGGSRGWVLNVGAGEPVFKIGTDSGWEFVTSEVSITESTWSHVAGVYDGARLLIFVDGKLTGTYDLSDSLTPSSLSLVIGNTPMSLVGTNTRPYEGLVDQVRISSTARYSSDFVPVTMNVTDEYTLALWGFNEGDGTIAHDLHGGGVDLNLHEVQWNRESIEGGSE